MDWKKTSDEIAKESGSEELVDKMIKLRKIDCGEFPNMRTRKRNGYKVRYEK